MILIGHKLIPSDPFYRIENQAQIAQTPPNATVCFDFDATLAIYCQTQNIHFALHVKNIEELILANCLGASYFLVDKSLALQAQKIADDYLFDGKILLESNDDHEIEFAATHAIDGIMFEDGFASL